MIANDNNPALAEFMRAAAPAKAKFDKTVGKAARVWGHGGTVHEAVLNLATRTYERETREAREAFAAAAALDYDIEILRDCLERK